MSEINLYFLTNLCCTSRHNFDSIIFLGFPMLKMGRSSVLKDQLFNYSWTVQLYNAWQGYSHEPLLSETFPNLPNSKLTWRMRLVLRNSEPKFSDKASLFLMLVSSDRSEVGAKFKFKILYSGSQTLVEASSETCIFSRRENHQIKCDGDCNRLNFLKSLVSNYVNYSLTIVCDVTVFPEQIKVPRCSLSDDFAQLFDNQKFSDVTLSVNGTEFQAHKNILAARSPVFAAMFEHDMEEKQSGKVEIHDFDGDVIKEMLLFIYTGKVLNLDKMADELLAAADKYQLDRLKAMCEKTLLNNLSIENASELLVLSDLHNAEQLKAQTIKFINENGTGVIETEGFKNMVKTKPCLVAEAFIALFTK